MKSWSSERSSFAGWEDENETPSWQEFSAQPGRDGMADLLMPRTATALRRAGAWLSAALGEGDDVESIVALAEAKRVQDWAARKLGSALDRLLAGAEFAPPPATQHDLDAIDRLLERIDAWFAQTGPRDRYRARARAVRATWSQAIAGQWMEGLALYRSLSATAAAKWPAIERKLEYEVGFDPTDADSWRGRTVKLAAVYNRVDADFVGPFRFVTLVRGIPVAGNYEPAVAGAVLAAQRRTQRLLDERVPWDVVAVVEGRSTILQRNSKRLAVKGSREALTVETWDPATCVTIRVTALHAGPVAIGPEEHR